MEDFNSLQCEHCAQPGKAGNKFCPGCGSPQVQQEISAAHKWSNIQGMALFFAVELIICLSALIIKKSSLATEIFFQGLLAFSAIAFFLSDWKDNKSLLKWSSFSLKKIIVIVLLTTLSAVIVHFLVELLNDELFNQRQSYYSPYSSYKYSKFLMIFFMAICPAIFEELAYRGYLLGKLLKVVDRNEAIYISSALFFLIHFSFFSFFWLLPFAMILAFLRIKENTLWYGIIIHFTFNLTACLVELFFL
ncbi:type II CAAX endopeptidase family protein [Pedobacter gandavensis]|uniref:CPBP family intramembrane glutamic endopeptidase n=1 Tax=Pedobacter gandavensis TaxID=2679963 RepID=UPI00292CFCC9|nr:type II CAAX endopeptidase family protein [Pedobacter gandavensis]